MAIPLLVMVEVMFWPNHAILPLWSYSLLAGEAPVLILFSAWKIKEIKADALPPPRVLVDAGDRQTAATLTKDYLATADTALLAWTGAVIAAHPVLVGAGIAAFGRILPQPGSLAGALYLAFAATAILAILCHVARNRINTAAMRAQTAIHVMLHQPGIGRFFRDVHSTPRDESAFGWASTLLRPISWLWAAISATFLLVGLVASFQGL